MKIKINKTFLSSILSLMIFSSSIYAAENGIYAGGQLGWADSNYTPKSLNIIYVPTTYQSTTYYLTGSTSPEINKAKAGARIFVGDQVNRFIAFEGGYTNYGYPEAINLYGYENLREPMSESAFDAQAKLSLPVSKRFNLYAKGGLAYVMTQHFSSSATTDGSALSFLTSFQYSEDDITALRPVYGAGISFDLTKSLSTDISWSQIIGGNNVPTTNFAAIGLTLHF
jgi:opacity protein-like surface antigen